MKIGPYEMPGLLTDAQETFDSFDLSDIMEEDHASVIVDTLVSEYGGKPANGLSQLGFDSEQIAELLGHDPDEEGEFDSEVLETEAEKIAQQLNQEKDQLAPDEWRRFYFEWDGGFYLMFGGDPSDAPETD